MSITTKPFDHAALDGLLMIEWNDSASGLVKTKKPRFAGASALQRASQCMTAGVSIRRQIASEKL